MGAGIAQVAARAGFSVVLCDVAEEFLTRGMKAIDKSLQREVDKERLSPDEKGAIMVAETMQVNMADVNIPHRNSPVSDKVTVSIGVSTAVPAANVPAGTLIADADKALYQAKQEGRNRIKITNR